MDDAPRSEPIPSLWPYLLCCAGAAAIVALGSIHCWHHSDSLTPVLVSLQRWTPFCWELDHIGMLVPLLALPVRHPVLNLVFQDAIDLFAALGTMYLLPRYLVRNASYPLAGTLCAGAFLAFAPAAWCHDFAINTFYGVWLGLGLLGLVVAESRADRPTSWRRWLAALALLTLAHWVYSATILVVGPMVVLRFVAWQCPSFARRLFGRTPETGTHGDPQESLHRSELLRHLLLIGLSFAAGYFLMCLPWLAEPTPLGTLPVREWPAIGRQLLWMEWCYLTPHHWPFFLLGAGLAGSLYLGVSDPLKRAAFTWRAVLVLVGAAAANLAFMSTRQWMQINQCNWRYAHPAAILLQAAPAILAVAPIYASAPERCRRLSLLAAPLLLLVALWQYHTPSLTRIHHDLDRTLGVCTADVLEARCTHVAGSYWHVWPVVFHANLTLRERHDPRTIWGISYRSLATRSLWQDLPVDELRVAVPVGDKAQAMFPGPCDDMAEAELYLKRMGLPPLEIVEKRPTIWVLGKKSGD
jgi:hypothetical protein